jgi:hypothetical protein
MTPALGVECALPKDFRPYGRDARWLSWLALTLALAAALMFGQGHYIQAKVWLAQILIEHSDSALRLSTGCAPEPARAMR